MKKNLLIVVSIFAVIFTTAAQSTLTINVTELEGDKGNLLIALYNSPNDFLSAKAQGKVVQIKGKTTKVIYENLPDGLYAIALFQDTNNNMTIDLQETGIPKEKYGFSNNIDPAKLSRIPNFEECSFPVNGNTDIQITAVSAIK